MWQKHRAERLNGRTFMCVGVRRAKKEDKKRQMGAGCAPVDNKSLRF